MNPSNANKIKIPIHNVEIGMTVAEDILNGNGLLLIAKGTQINENNLVNLRLYQIFYIYIYDLPKTEKAITRDIKDIPEKKLFSLENPNFGQFTENYADNVILANQYLSQISQGASISLDDLFRLSNEMMNLLKTPSDMFNFFYHLEYFDDYTYTHCLNVSMLCNIFGRWLKLQDKQLLNLTVAGLLHDIGKLSISLDIINKPGKLTDDEFELIKRHTIIGYELIKNQDFPEDVKLAVLQHHERFDGTGYPNGLTNDKLSSVSKIVAIMDIYDALTSDRSYHKRMCPFKVIKTMEKDGYNALDTGYIYIFFERIAQTFVGSNVMLNNNEVGKVVFINRRALSRPFLDISGKIMDLMSEPSLEIVEIL